jgi:hypothetical protein
MCAQCQFRNQNYPNPFNPVTQIKYQMPKSCFIEINVYNILGRKVASLFKGNKQAGFHTITWNASTFSSGVYFIKMKTPHFSDTKKCILLNPNYTLVNVGVQFIEPSPNVSMRVNIR